MDRGEGEEVYLRRLCTVLFAPSKATPLESTCKALSERKRETIIWMRSILGAWMDSCVLMSVEMDLRDSRTVSVWRRRDWEKGRRDLSEVLLHLLLLGVVDDSARR